MSFVALAREPRWRVALFLALATALNYADRAAMSAALPAVRVDLGISDVSLGLLGSVFLWSYALGSPFAGALADRRSRRGLVIGSLTVWSAVTALVGLVNAFPMLLALRLGLGLAECFFLPAAVALIAEVHGTPTRGRALSFVLLGVNGGMVFGGSFTGFMADHHGWRSGFWILGLGGIGLALLARLLLPPAPGTASDIGTVNRPSFAAAIRFLLRVPSYHVLLAESLLSGFGMWVFFGWLPLYFRETYAMSLAEAGFAGTFMLQISVMLGVLVGGWLSDRVAANAPHRRMLLYGVFYLVAAPFLLLFLGRPNFWVVAAGISAFSFLRGIGQANDNPTQCEIVPPQYRSTGIGFMNAIATASGGCGVFLAGLLKRSLGLGTIFAGIAGIFLLAGLALLLGYRFFLRTDIAQAQAAEQGSQP
jgi:predicted MFS family arabinose efflux permease